MSIRAVSCGFTAVVLGVLAGAPNAASDPGEGWEEYRLQLKRVRDERSQREQRLRTDLASAIRRNDPVAFSVAAATLGEMRSVKPDIIRLLVSSVAWNPYVDGHADQSTRVLRGFDYLPAAASLSQIGNRASAHLIRSLENGQDDDRILRIAAGVLVNCEASYLRELDGTARAVALTRLESRLSSIDHRDREAAAIRVKKTIEFVRGYIGEPYGQFENVPRFAIQYNLKPAVAGIRYACKVPVLPPIASLGEQMRVELTSTLRGELQELPRGLTLTQDGWIKGVPDSPGAYVCAFRARRSIESKRDEHNSREFRLLVLSRE